MALITNPAKKGSLSILASDLAGTTEFDVKQTLPVMDITSDKYNEGMSLYLQKLGIDKIDAAYNNAVKQFEIQMQEQELAAKIQATTAAESASNVAVEAQPGLGTGAAAVASEGRQAVLQKTNASIEQTMVETYQQGLNAIAEGYQAKLESILGKYDATTGTFENLANYETMSNKVTEAMARVIAKSLGATDAQLMSDDYISLLAKSGLVEETNTPGEVVLTDLGQAQIDALINSVDVNDPNALLDGSTLVGSLAQIMAMQDYNTGYISEEGETTWDLLSESKKQSLITEYASWIYNNQDNLRLSAWNLYEVTDKGVVLDTIWQAEEADFNKAEFGITDEGMYVSKINADTVSDCTEEECAIVKQNILSGKIPDGSYFMFQAGEVYKNDKYYYVKNNMVYETEYTANDPPPIIDVNAASVTSFGNFTGVNEGGKQDNWVNKIIESAKAGKIPDGTYINMNYGKHDSGKKGWYIYSDGKFTRISGETEVGDNKLYQYVKKGGNYTYIPAEVSEQIVIYHTDNEGIKLSYDAEEYLDW